MPSQSQRLAPCLALLVLAGPLAAWGGSRGYTAVLAEAGQGGLFQRPSYATFVEGGFEGTAKAEACWRRSATGGERFGLIVRKVLPEGFDAPLAQALWEGRPGAAAKAQRILRAQPASDGSAYDGAFVLHLDGRKVTVLALGARGALGAKHPLRGPSFVWDDSRPEATAQALDQALCAAAKPLGVGFQP